MGREYPIRSPKGGDGNSPSKLAEGDELFSVRGLSPDTRLPHEGGVKVENDLLSSAYD